MKISQETKKILENFSAINPSLLFLEGTSQATMSPAGGVFAQAEISEDIPQDFCIYDLRQFISFMTLFEDAQIEFKDDRLVVKDGRTSAEYAFAKENLIKHPPKGRKIPFNDTVAEFVLEEDKMARLFSSASIMKLPHIVLSNDGSNVSVSLASSDTTVKTSDSFTQKFDSVSGEELDDFKVVLEIRDLNFLPGDYTVSIAEKKNMVRFKSDARRVEYIVAVVS